MNPVCQPIEAEKRSLSLAESYLNKRISIKSGEVLFNKNNPLSAIYAVCSGTFKLCDSSSKSKEKILGFRFPGELLGEDALFPEKYGYSAIAIGDSSVCQVAVDELMSCSNLVPDLQSNLLVLLIKQSYINQREFQSLVAKKTAESLLSSFLLNITDRCSAHYGSTTTIHLSISRDNIANFLGLRRETLSRIFSKLQKEGLIQISGKKIHLLELNKLANLAEI